MLGTRRACCSDGSDDEPAEHNELAEPAEHDEDAEPDELIEQADQADQADHAGHEPSKLQRWR